MKWWPGLALIAVGVLWLLNILGVLTAEIWIFVWPALIIFFGIYTVLRGRNLGFGLLAVAGGVYWLLINLGRAIWDGRIILPAVLIAVGVQILASRLGWRDRSAAEGDAVFTTAEHTAHGGVFTGTEVTAVFGKNVLDLRGYDEIVSGARVEVNAVFGSVEILVPKGCFVEKKGISCVFGGVSAGHNPSPGPVSIALDGSAVFGGVQIVYA